MAMLCAAMANSFKVVLVQQEWVHTTVRLQVGSVDKLGGKVGFNTFSHRKSCLIRMPGLEKVNDLRVPVRIASHLSMRTNAEWLTSASPSTKRSLLGCLGWYLVVSTDKRHWLELPLLPPWRLDSLPWALQWLA